MALLKPYDWRDYDVTQESERLRSFENWSIPFIKKEDLAKSGFYFTGFSTADAVECFSCDIPIGYWEEGDVPDEQHRLNSPNCAYLNRSNVINMQRVSLYPGYSTKKDREQTFNDWPHKDQQSTNDLTEAGFFYDESDQMIKCYDCGLIVQDWKKEDDPWVVHIFKKPRCHYARVIKGDPYVRGIYEDCLKKEVHLRMISDMGFAESTKKRSRRKKKKFIEISTV